MSVKRHKNFAASKPKKVADADKLTFSIADKVFVPKQEVQGVVILDFVAAAEEGSARVAAQVMKFFKSVLPEEEHAKFIEYINGDEVIVEMETLSEIVAYLIEEYTARPLAE